MVRLQINSIEGLGFKAFPKIRGTYKSLKQGFASLGLGFRGTHKSLKQGFVSLGSILGSPSLGKIPYYGLGFWGLAFRVWVGGLGQRGLFKGYINNII